MRIIIPQNFDYDDIESSIPEGDEPLWDSATTYAKGDVVRIGYSLFTSIADNNSGNNPEKTSSGTYARWAKSGVTNRGALFDNYLYTQSVAEEQTPLSVTVPWVRSTGFALFNITGAVNLTMEVRNSADEIVASKKYNLLYGVDNWYDYFAYNFSFIRDLTDFDFGGFMNGKATFTLRGSQPAAGHLVIGDLHEPGATLYGATAELINYSNIETNEFGVTDIVERVSAKRYDCQLYLHPRRADSIFDLFDQLRAKPCVWIGDNRTSDEGGHASLTVFGLYKSASLTFDGPNECVYDMEITGFV